MRTQTKKLTAIAMLSALAYIAMAFGRIPVVLFLKYDPKDIIITLGGFLYGPFAAFIMSMVVSFAEMLTVSETGLIGVLMNVISTCSFACTAAVIYKKHRNFKGAAIGLLAGWLTSTAIMMLWNYLIAPLYMTIPRETIAKLLFTAFLPFNLLKGGLNAAITMLIYKPVMKVMRKSNMLPGIEEEPANTKKINISIILVSFFIIATCVMFILVFQKVI